MMIRSKGVIPAICDFLHNEWSHMATNHPLYFLYCEAQLGWRNGTEIVPVFVCFVNRCRACYFLVIHPALAAVQDLFSSFYVTASHITDATVLSFFSLLLLLPLPLFFYCHFPFVRVHIRHPAVCKRYSCMLLPGVTHPRDHKVMNIHSRSTPKAPRLDSKCRMRICF